MTKTKKNLAIIGATGAVGREMISVLERRKSIAISSLKLFASEKSVGEKITYNQSNYIVEELTKDSFHGIDIALFSAGSNISRLFAPIAKSAGAIVIDNSSTFRMDQDVPLVIPEINSEAIKNHSGIISNPNCTTAITLLALYPLHQSFGLERIIAATYQAVSGSGAKAITELSQQVQAISDHRPIQKTVYNHQIAFNLIPHVDTFTETGYTREEMKMQNEGRRIMSLPHFKASVTCVRVPVYRAHSVAVTAQFQSPVCLERAYTALKTAPGLDIYDEPHKCIYPMPIECSYQDNCRVGRLRVDISFPNALSFWICGDQLLKGAALNAIQIAELL